jgi:hypothetical protein
MFFVEYSTSKGNFVMPKPTKEEAENFAKLVKQLKGLYFTRIREDKETIITETDTTAPLTHDDYQIDWGRVKDY